MDNKRVLLIGPVLRNLTNFRGELLERLVAQGYDVTLACSLNGEKVDSIRSTVRLVDVPIDRRGTSVFHDLKLIRHYMMIVSELKPDVVLTYTTKCSVYGGIACRLKGVPYIVNNSGLYNKDDFSRKMWMVLNLLYKAGYSKADCMMYQNSYERDTLNKIIGNKVPYVDLPGSGINLSKYPFTEYPSEDKGLVFNYVARIVNIKGIREYIACAGAIKAKYPQATFRIFGRYENDIYAQMVKEAVSKGIVQYCGPQENMFPYVKSCHAVIHPSYYEGMTNVVLEHSAVGRVCLASDIPGCREGVEDGVTGFLFEKKNPLALIEAVEKFINLSVGERAEMGRRARQKMEKEFDRRIVVDAYMNEIEKICQNKK